MTKQPVGQHSFSFNPKDNSGEGLTLETEIFDNGDKENNIYLNQTLNLQSYCNSATFNLAGAQITPDKLRQLANELEKEINKHN